MIEPSCPGVVDHYIDLGRFYDAQGLQAHRGSILACMAENKAAYRRCYRCLSAAGTLQSDMRELVITDDVTAKLAKRAKGIISRELRRGGGQEGRVTHRFLTAITCQGRMALWETVNTGCKRVYELWDNYGLAHELLLPILNAAAARGYDVIACPSPLSPDRLEHLLIPALDLAFVTSTKELPYSGSRPYRRLRLDAIASAGAAYPTNRARARFSLKVSSILLDEAIQALAQAKACHDELEKLYNPYVDFPSVYAEADALAQQIIPAELTASPQ